MLQEAQRTSATGAIKVSISTAVWMVMCREPATRAPFSGCLAAYSSRIAIRPGISVSAMRISLRPQSARNRTATKKTPEERTTANKEKHQKTRAPFQGAAFLEPGGDSAAAPLEERGDEDKIPAALRKASAMSVSSQGA